MRSDLRADIGTGAGGLARDIADITGEGGVVFDRSARDIGADVAAEQVTEPLAFGESDDHLVES